MNVIRRKRFEFIVKLLKGINKFVEVDLLKVRFIWCRCKFCGFGFVEIYNEDLMD